MQIDQIEGFPVNYIITGIIQQWLMETVIAQRWDITADARLLKYLCLN